MFSNVEKKHDFGQGRTGTKHFMGRSHESGPLSRYTLENFLNKQSQIDRPTGNPPGVPDGQCRP